LARNIQDRATLKAILAGFLFIHVGITILAVLGTANGLMSEGIVDIVIHGLLAVGFGYFLLAKTKAPSKNR